MQGPVFECRLSDLEMKAGLFRCLIDGFLRHSRLVATLEPVEQLGHAVDELDLRTCRNNITDSHIMLVHVQGQFFNRQADISGRDMDGCLVCLVDYENLSATHDKLFQVNFKKLFCSRLFILCRRCFCFSLHHGIQQTFNIPLPVTVFVQKDLRIFQADTTDLDFP